MGPNRFNEHVAPRYRIVPVFGSVEARFRDGSSSSAEQLDEGRALAASTQTSST